MTFPGTFLRFLESFTFTYSHSIDMFNKTELKTQGSFVGGKSFTEDISVHLGNAIAWGHGPCCWMLLGTPLGKQNQCLSVFKHTQKEVKLVVGAGRSHRFRCEVVFGGQVCLNGGGGEAPRCCVSLVLCCTRINHENECFSL